jgi:hypothetical protein
MAANNLDQFYTIPKYTNSFCIYSQEQNNENVFRDIDLKDHWRKIENNIKNLREIEVS